MAIGMRAGELFYRLSVAGFGAARAGVKAFGDTFHKLGTKIRAVSRVVAVAMTAIGGATLYGMKKLVNLASEAQEQGSKFNVVFKEQAGIARDFARNLGDSVGRSRYELEKFLAAMQDTFVPLGFTRSRARDLSQQMVRLAIDVASFNNAADDEVLRNFQSAIVGNHEAVRSYGIIITEADLKQEMLRMGMKKSYQQATALEKVQARLNLILRGTEDAQGDAARTAGSYANRVKALQGKLHELAVEIGERLLPAATKLIESIIASMPTLERWGKMFADAFEAIAGGADKAVGNVKALKAAMADLNAAIAAENAPGATAADRVAAIRQQLKAMGELREATIKQRRLAFEKRAIRASTDLSPEKKRTALWLGPAFTLPYFIKMLRTHSDDSEYAGYQLGVAAAAGFKEGAEFDKAIAKLREQLKGAEEEVAKDAEEAAKRIAAAQDERFRAARRSMQAFFDENRNSLREQARDWLKAARESAKSVQDFLYTPLQKQAVELNDTINKLLGVAIERGDSVLYRRIEMEGARRRRELAKTELESKQSERVQPSFVGLTEAWRMLARQTAAPVSEIDQKMLDALTKQLEQVKPLAGLGKQQIDAIKQMPRGMVDALREAGLGTLGP